jgi:hypothetical protein
MKFFVVFRSPSGRMLVYGLQLLPPLSLYIHSPCTVIFTCNPTPNSLLIDAASFSNKLISHITSQLRYIHLSVYPHIVNRSKFIYTYISIYTHIHKKVKYGKWLWPYQYIKRELEQ